MDRGKEEGAHGAVRDYIFMAQFFESQPSNGSIKHPTSSGRWSLCLCGNLTQPEVVLPKIVSP